MKKEQQLQELAKLIYLKENLTQKAIAERVGINEKTIKRWIDEGRWESLKTTLLTTKESELKSLYKQLSLVNVKNTIALEDDDPDTNPNYDELRKLTKSIRELEGETNVGQMFETIMALIDFIRIDSLADAQLVNKYADRFIKERLNSFQ